MADSQLASAQVTVAALNRSLDAYTIKRQVGHGAMGIVFEAEQKGIGRRVALKVLPPNLALRERTVKRFLREAESMGKLGHPNVVDVYEVGSRADFHFFTMKFVDGPSLDRVLKAGPLAVKDVIGIGIDVATALAHAHARGVLHRDIKPGNLLRDGERILLTDFGLARQIDGEDGGTVTESGDLVGTPLYMAPEQISGEFGRIDGRADIWGLGVTLYELLTDKAPFAGTNASAILHSILQREPTRVRKLRPDVPRDLEAVIHRCMEKDPAQRYTTSSELVEDLVAVREGKPVTARAPRFFDPIVRWIRRHPLPTGIVAASLVITLTLGLAFRWVFNLWKTSNSEKNVAEQQVKDAEEERLQAERERDDQKRERAVAVARRTIADARQLWSEGRAQDDEIKQLEATERILDVLRAPALQELTEVRAETLELAATFARAQGRTDAQVLEELEPLFGAIGGDSGMLFRAAVLSGLGRYEEALSLHGLRIVQRPTDPMPLMSAARIERRLGLEALERHDLERAERLLLRATGRLGAALELAGEGEVRLSVLVERARCHLDLCQPLLARRDVETALAADPGHVDAQATLVAIARQERTPRPFGARSGDVPMTETPSNTPEAPAIPADSGASPPSGTGPGTEPAPQDSQTTAPVQPPNIDPSLNALERMLRLPKSSTREKPNDSQKPAEKPSEKPAEQPKDGQ